MNTNPKALNLEALKNSHAKVTLGFKCLPGIKLDLAQKANDLGLTLSEYVENLIMNSEKLFEKYRMQEMLDKEKLAQTIIEQNKKIDFYQNDYMKKLFEQNKNEIAEYTNVNNESVKVKIIDMETLFTVLINAFKIEKNETNTNTISFSQRNSK